jgi:DNA invertase Pin-like site-specific DNA recombinase
MEVLSKLNERRIGLCSLNEQIDTTTSGGKLIFHVFGALAEFERDLIRERTKAGLAAARARGHLGERRKALSTPTKVEMAQALYNDKRHSIGEICKVLQISRATL